MDSQRLPRSVGPDTMQEYGSLRHLTKTVYSEVSDQIPITLLHSHMPIISVAACDLVYRLARPHPT